ncbi:MAG: NAD(P) transhydrogenase subunit alpha [Desulfobacteraceae bacterium]
MGNLSVLAGVLIFSFIIGYVLISRIPSLLHTPLMSMTNAVSAVTILGVLLIFSVASSPIELMIGSLALVLATFNLVGGFVITDRMLKMFKHQKEESGRND